MRKSTQTFFSVTHSTLIGDPCCEGCANGETQTLQPRIRQSFEKIFPINIVWEVRVGTLAPMSPTGMFMIVHLHSTRNIVGNKDRVYVEASAACGFDGHCHCSRW